MKKIFMAMTIALLSATGAVAQETSNPERKQPSKTEMIQHRTDRMAERYSLTDEQKAKVMELNTKYADIIAMPRRGQGRQQRGMRPEGQRFRHNADSLQAQPKLAKADRKEKINDKEKSEKKDGPRGRDGNSRRGDFEKMQQTMEAYNAELKSILTEEQYAAFEADRNKMKQRR